MEELEPRLVLSGYHFDFGTTNSPVAAGYVGVPVVAYSQVRGYGWASTKGITAHDTGIGNSLTRDFHSGTNGTFLVNVPNGVYEVQPTLGDATAHHDDINLWLNGQQVASNLTTQAGQFIQPDYKVQVTNGQLSLRLQDGGGSSPSFAIDGLDILPYTPPVAQAGSNLIGNEGSPVSFKGTATGTGLLSYSWQFGDGTSATGTLTPAHTYADDGSYTATLTVTDAVGGTSSSSLVVTVNNVPPSVTITGLPSTGQSPEGKAIALGSTVTDPSPVDMAAGFRYAWGVTKNGSAYATGPSSTFSFTPDDDGTYVVSLSATDEDGGTSPVQSATILVYNVPPKPNPLGPYTGTVGVAIDFVAIAKDPSSVDTAAGFTYSWNFGDGTRASGPTPTHSYAAAGQYSVTVTVTDEDGGSRSASSTATVSAMGVTGTPTDFQLDSTNLLTNTVYGHLAWDQMAPDGANGVNAAWEQGTSSSWYIEEQRYGEDLIIGGLLHNNTSAINAGFTMFNWGFAHQAADGSFAGTADPFHSTSFFVAAVAHACLVIEQSPQAAQYASQVATYTQEVYKSALWMISPSVWSTGLSNDSPYTHRRYLVADALALTSFLVGGDANLMAAARYEIQDGLSLQWSNGVNPEKGGYDSSYQTVGLAYAELWVTYFPNETLTTRVVTMINNGLAWEETMILSSGEISIVGDTRTGVETGPSGKVKTVDWKKAVTAFAYWAAETENLRWEGDGQKVAQFYYRLY